MEYATIAFLARSIREGKLSPVELTRHCLDRIQTLDGKLAAFREVCPEKAMAQARAAEAALGAGRDLGPLHGIPFGAKDLFDVREMATGAGFRPLRSRVAQADAAAVDLLIRAGAVLLGKTHTVQFAFGGVGINHDEGTPHNPWAREPHVPGGSSSGSAVAVAAGMVPTALGSDTGGSVRIPAALCGITGLKTTVGRVSRAGVYPLSSTLDSVGPLARTAEDAALMYQALCGPDLRDDTTWGLPAQDVLQTLKRGARGLRLAFPETMFWEEADPEVERAVRDCGQVFRDLGASVGSLPFFEAEEAARIGQKGPIIATEAYANNRTWVDDHLEKLDPVIAFRIGRGKEIPAYEYVEALQDMKRVRAEAMESLRDVDALLVPTTRVPALPVKEVDQSLESYTQANWGYLRNTTIGNILNLCGLSVPCGFTSQGLPIGLMIYGKPFQEEVVLRIGHAFQEATRWQNRTPDLSWIQEA